MTLQLDLSIGPVQGFVAQARRTRDLWGGSYLLSFLSGHAMRGAETAGGRIVRPVVANDPLYRRISGRGHGEPPRIGSLPNRFAVEVDGDAAEFANAARTAFEAAWERVCAAVWEKFVAHAHESGDGTRAIWDRQTGAFWELTWTAGPAEDGLLARRKHWRCHWPPEEPGDKCTVIHDLQELSGHIRSTGAAGRAAQDGFWARLGERADKLDLRDKERLCAVALVKRLFPLVSTDALGWAVERSRWPSTVHVAARPWLQRVEAAAPEQARGYAELVERSAPGGVLSERRPPGWGPVGAAGKFPRLDANWFHREWVGNERLCPLEAGAGDETREELGEALKTIYGARDRAGQRLGSPSAFYALLLADGDRLGRLVGTLGGDRVGEALAGFTNEVPEVIRRYGGETVYAGGDDVLAMLPAPTALRGAAKLSERYRAAFDRLPAATLATLSAAVVFAHIRYPLGAALREAHRLLDAVAKEENGRDSLAAAVLKPGGLNLQWVTTWQRPDDAGGSSVALIEALADRLRTAAPEPGLSSALLYRVRELLVRIGGGASWRPGAWSAVPEALDTPALLRAEIAHSLAVRGGESAAVRAGEIAAAVWALLRRAPASGNADEAQGATEIGADALLLARFLAGHGQSEDAS